MKNTRKTGSSAILLALLLTVCMAFSGCGSGQTASVADAAGSQSSSSQTEQAETSAEPEEQTERSVPAQAASGNSSISMSDIPAYSGDPYVAVNDNQPDFSAADLTTQSYEQYSDLDSLGRCGVCVASVGKDLMPDDKRGSIGMVKPTGWHTVKYDSVDGKYLYNRCHLIGYQLTAENANKKNLITGTRYLNIEGMLPFENLVADYVKETGNHVLYRVTPVFTGDNLLADGVHMEAESVEDKGEGVLFNVFCYNVQPGITIDYATGDSHESGDSSGAASEQTTASDTKSASADNGSGAAASSSSAVGAASVAAGSAAGSGASEGAAQSAEPSSPAAEYVININTGKFHAPGCRTISLMNEENKKVVTESRDELIAQGYDPCGVCHP